MRDLQLRHTPTGLEPIYHYRPGGYHPVYLGDQFQGEYRYRVIHKLGHGGFATVWLCQVVEKRQYVAVKILMAASSGAACAEINGVTRLQDAGLVRNETFCQPLDMFQIKGPNGSHLCFVYPVAGPRVSDIPQIFNDPDMVLRKVALQAARALATLHEHGVCHGDYIPANILLRLSDLDGLSESEIIQALGEPMTTEVFKTSGEPLELTVPKYLVYPLDYNEIDQRFFTEDIYVIDFGEPSTHQSPQNFSVYQEVTAHRN